MKRDLFDNTNIDKSQELHYHYDKIMIFVLKIYNNRSLSIETTIMCTDIHIQYDDNGSINSESKVVFKNGPLGTVFKMYKVKNLRIDEDDMKIIIKYEGEN